MSHPEGHTEVTTEDAIADALNYTHALTGMGGGAVMLLLIGFAGKAIYAKFREGLVVKSEITDDKGEYLFVDKEEFEKSIEHRKEHEITLYEKIGGRDGLSERLTAVETTVENLNR